LQPAQPGAPAAHITHRHPPSPTAARSELALSPETYDAKEAILRSLSSQEIVMGEPGLGKGLAAGDVEGARRCIPYLAGSSGGRRYRRCTLDHDQRPAAIGRHPALQQPEWVGDHPQIFTCTEDQSSLPLSLSRPRSLGKCCWGKMGGDAANPAMPPPILARSLGVTPLSDKNLPMEISED
jgi:hypothetical protein